MSHNLKNINNVVVIFGYWHSPWPNDDKRETPIVWQTCSTNCRTKCRSSVIIGRRWVLFGKKFHTKLTSSESRDVAWIPRRATARFLSHQQVCRHGICSWFFSRFWIEGNIIALRALQKQSAFNFLYAQPGQLWSNNDCIYALLTGDFKQFTRFYEK